MKTKLFWYNGRSVVHFRGLVVFPYSFSREEAMKMLNNIKVFLDIVIHLITIFSFIKKRCPRNRRGRRYKR